VTSDHIEAFDSRAGQAVYSRWTLQLYDLYVLGLSCRLAWRCPGASTAVTFEIGVSALSQAAAAYARQVRSVRAN